MCFVLFTYSCWQKDFQLQEAEFIFTLFIHSVTEPVNQKHQMSPCGKHFHHLCPQPHNINDRKLPVLPTWIMREERWDDGKMDPGSILIARRSLQCLMHRHGRSPAPHPFLPCLTSCAHFWRFPPVTVSRHDKEKPFPTRAPLASVGWAEVRSLAQGGTLIILVCKIVLRNIFGVLATGNDSQRVQREKQGAIA